MTFIDQDDDNPFLKIKNRDPDTSPPPSALVDLPKTPIVDPKKIKANSSIVGNQDADPDEAGKTLQLAQNHNTSPELIDVDPKKWETHLNTEQNIAIANANPAVQSYLAGNPMAAKVSKDDLGVLDTITRFIKDAWTAHQKFNPAFNMGKAVEEGGNEKITGEFIKTMEPSLWVDATREGFASYQYGQMLERYRTGDEATRNALRPQIQAYDAEQQSKPKSGANYVQNLLGGFLGQVGASLPEIAQYGTYGMATGAAIGTAAGPAGTAAGAITGLGAGVAAGFAITMATGSAGHIYHAVENIEGISEGTKQTLAMGGGLVVGLLGARGGAVVQDGVAQIIQKFTSDAAGKAALSSFAATAAKYSAEGAVINGSQVFAQLLSEQIAKVLGTRDLKTVLNDKEEASKFIGEVAQGAIDGAVIGGALSTVHSVPGRGTRQGDTLISNKTLADANKLDELMKMSQESKTKERFPGMFAEALKQERDPPLFIDPQVVKDNKNFFSFVPDLDAQLAMSSTLGTEIKIPQSDFLAHMPPEVYALMRDKVRQGGDALTPEEAKATQLAMQKADEQLAAKAAEAAGETPPPAPAATADATTRDALIDAIWGDQTTPTPEATPQAPPTIEIPGLPQITLPPEVSQARSLLDRILGRRAVPTLDDIAARVRAENEARIRAGIKPMPPETPMQQVQTSPQPEALAVSSQAVTETTPGRVGESPAAETVPPAIDADKVVQKEVMIGSIARKTILEELRELSDASHPTDKADVILALALRREPGNLAELRTFINEEAKEAGIADPKEIHDRAAAAVAALSTKLIKDEGASVVYGLTDKDARSTAVATAKEIDSSRHIQWLAPLFNAADLTPADRAAYNEHLLDVQRQLTEAIFDSAREVTEKKETKVWRDNEARMRPEVERKIAQTPVIMADEFFRTGRATGLGEQTLIGKLDRAEVDTMFTPEELRAMGVKGKKLSLNKLLTSSMFGKGESVMSADLLASTFGYKDGKTMMKELIEFRQSLKETGETPQGRFDSLVDQEVGTRMIAEHGNLEAIIEKNALKAAHDIAQDKVFGLELKALSKLSGVELMKADDVKKLVSDHMDTMTNAEAMDAERYKTLAGKHGRRAQALKDAGDYPGALQAKQDQVKATLMARQANEISKQVTRTENIVEKYADKPRVEAVSPEFNTRILQLIEALGLPIKGRTPETLARDVQATKEPSYMTWAQERKDKFGEAIPSLSSLNRGDPPVKSVKEMTVANTRELNEAIRTLEQLGKTDDSVRVGNTMMKVEDVKAELAKQLEGIGDRFPETPVPEKSTRKALQAELLKTETVVRKADRLSDTGILQRVLINPIKKAQDAHWLLRRKVADFLRDVDHGEWTLGMNRLDSTVPNTSIFDKQGNPLKLTRGNMLMVALNWGTEQGRALMSNTLRTDVTTVHDWLQNNMTKKNWDYVENIWRMFDNIITPEMDKVYRAQRGFGMEKPDAINFIDGFSKNRQGGYFPLIRERYGVLPTLKESVVFDNRLYDSLPSNSHKAVLKAGEFPLSLDFDQLPFRIGEQIHSIAYREAVRDVSKIVNDNGFTTMMREAFGNEQAGLFKPWIRDIANDGGRYDNTVAHGWQWVFRSLLRNAIQTFTGYNTATALIHSPSAATNTFGELRFRTFRAIASAIGDSQLANLAKKIVMSPENAEKYADFAWKNSVELRSRWKSSDNDIRKSLGQWSAKETLNYYAEWWGQSIISYSDYMTATVAWHGGYQKAIAAGLSHEEAVAAGDKLVRAAHGSMAIADKSQFNRERNTQQFAAFYGFFNHVMNQQHLAGFEVTDAVRNAVNEKSYSQMGKQLNSALWKGMSSAFFYAVAQSFIHDAVRGDHKEDEHWGKKLADELMGFGAGMIPGVREAGFAAGHAWSVASIPTTALLDIPRRWKRDVDKWVNKGGKLPVRTSIEMAGALGVRLGTRQIARWAEEMQNIMRGDSPPPSDFQEWKRLFIYGHSRPVGMTRGNKSNASPFGGSGGGKATTKNPMGL